jgi:hypothetical protein
VVVNVAFLANFLVLALVWSTLAAPGVNPEISAAFETALAPATGIVAGSLLLICRNVVELLLVDSFVWFDHGSSSSRMW